MASDGILPSHDTTVTIQAAPTKAGTIQLITISTYTQLGDGSYQAAVTISNVGTGTAQGVVLTGATLGAGTGTPTPQPLIDIPPGGIAVTTFSFPANSGAPGAHVVAKYTGTYTGGTFGGKSPVPCCRNCRFFTQEKTLTGRDHTMKRNLTLALMLLTMGLLSSMPAAYADSITLTLLTPTVMTTVGTTTMFDATVSAPSATLGTINLNADSFNISAPATIDDTGFLDNFVSIAPGETINDLLFTVTIPLDGMVGEYTGAFTLLGDPTSRLTMCSPQRRSRS